MTENVAAAARRADHVRALNEEREGYVRAGKDDRVKQVDAELKRFAGPDATPKGRRAPKPDQV